MFSGNTPGFTSVCPGGARTSLSARPVAASTIRRTGTSALLIALLWVAGAWPAFSQTSPVYAWTNFAGQPGGMGNVDGTGRAARFRGVGGMAVDSTGDLIVVGTPNNTIRKVTPDGVVTTLAGELTVAAYANLGGLGATQGPPARFVWTLPNLLAVLLPWLAVLALLALPSNRNPRAWWIWAPLVGATLLAVGLERAFEAADSEDVGQIALAVASAVAFGLAAIWLLGGALARRRVFGIGLLALAFAAVSLLALVASPFFWKQGLDWIGYAPETPYWLLLFAILNGLVYAGALNLTGWRCRQRLSGVRISLWLLFWLWPMWVVAMGLLMGAMREEMHSIEIALLPVPVIFSLISFGLVLPFLVLSFSSSFYRERLNALLRLPATAPAPIAKVPPATAEQGTPHSEG